MLEIKDLHASIDGIEIIKGLSLSIKAGEVHAIMGPNGSGKSTLTKILAGHPDYEITAGSILFEGKDLRELSIEERAKSGIFLAFQYPVELPGVSNIQFLKAAMDALHDYRQQPAMDAVKFLKHIRAQAKAVDLEESFLQRGVNEGFSGGEKKRNEIMQMLVLEPNLAILDETDSGLDIDALQVVAKGVNTLRDQNRSFLMVTHYQRLLTHIVPDYVHVLAGGRIVKSGGKELALELEEKGYGWIEKEVA